MDRGGRRDRDRRGSLAPPRHPPPRILAGIWGGFGVLSVAEALSCGKAAPLQPYPSLSISRGGGGEGRPTQATLLLLPDGARMDREGRDCPVDPAYPPLAVQRGLRPRQLIAETANARHPLFLFVPSPEPYP